MMDGGFQFGDAFAGIGADHIDVFGIDTGIDQQIAATLDIAFTQIRFGDHPDGGDVIGVNEVRRYGILRIDAGIDQDHQSGIHGDIDGLT